MLNVCAEPLTERGISFVGNNSYSSVAIRIHHSAVTAELRRALGRAKSFSLAIYAVSKQNQWSSADVAILHAALKELQTQLLSWQTRFKAQKPLFIEHKDLAARLTVLINAVILVCQTTVNSIITNKEQFNQNVNSLVELITRLSKELMFVAGNTTTIKTTD